MEGRSLIFLSALASVPAYAGIRETLEAGLGIALYNFVRDHPWITLLIIAAIVAVLAVVLLKAIRQVKTEARGYADYGRSTWTRVRTRGPFRRRNDSDKPETRAG